MIMTKHQSWIAALFISLASLISCTKGTSEEAYNAAQKEVLNMMHGSFTSSFFGILTIQVSFDSQYPKPFITTFDNGATTEIHGELTYKTNGTYHYYYRIHPDAKGISLYTRREAIKDPIVYDLIIVDSDTFKWKTNESSTWYTFRRD